MKMFDILRDERGTSVVEMGMLAPVLATLIIGTSDLALAYSEKLRLEQASQSAIEKVMQRNSDAGTTILTLKVEASQQANVPITQVDVDYWLECNGTRQGQYDVTCPTGQTYARYLQVSIESEYDPMFPAKLFGANDRGKYPIHGQAGIRTQ
ncbi:TadE/TadG family type IV pilus assembly protein [Sphingomicrobium lutaoense]|uniref:Flp pilus assembly protein TadG n=1 Tax=Sphingomicrobium lutaoense TaxID=515949 RepID=A0A839YZZ3_9SPHN|nr:TadE/TadG family type IV pilus assembly protein [Sphingomicrobium lutaoense]MBB3764020.1 Flp pilus assembly protein TadG [Sphingomicrobium lutaoense]